MIVKSTEWAIKSQSSLPSHLFLFLTPEAGLKNVHVCTPNKWPILFLCSLSWQNHDRDNARTFGSLSEGAAHRDWKGKAVKVTPAVVVREWVRQLVLKVTFRKKKKENEYWCSVCVLFPLCPVHDPGDGMVLRWVFISQLNLRGHCIADTARAVRPGWVQIQWRSAITPRGNIRKHLLPYR